MCFMAPIHAGGSHSQMNKHNIHRPRTLRRKALTAGLAVSFAAVGAGEALAQAQTSAGTSTTGAV